MRTETKVLVKTIYKYKKPGFGRYAYYEDAYIYVMADENSRTYVWKTTSVLDEDGNIINKGDVIRIKATIKAETKYKGQIQTEVQRVVLVARLAEAESKTEYLTRKAEEQKQSLNDGDIIWEMPYRQYKSSYADCETVVGSFRRTEDGKSLIQVIIRDGRCKPSGVRGEHFNGYEFSFTSNGKAYTITYKTVCEENAYRRLMGDYPEATNIKITAIY